MTSISYKTWMVAIACAFLAAPVSALTINDPGVVGFIDTDIDVNGGQPTLVANEVAWANSLLALGINQNQVFDSANDVTSPERERYRTSSTDYNAVLTGGTQVQAPAGSPLPSALAYQYILVKYDGPNAGYVLYNVAAAGGTYAEYPSPVWGTGEQYRVSHITGFGASNVPDGGATLLLMGVAMGALGAARRFTKR